MGKRLCNKERNDGTVERQPLKRNTIENKQTMMPENNMTQKEGEELGTSITGLVSENDTTEVEIDIFYETKERVETTDETKTQLRDEEKLADRIPRSGTDRVKQYNENEEGTTNLSDGTLEISKMIVPSTGEQDEEQCHMLYKSLTEDGLELTQEVVTAVFTRETGKSAKMLLEKFTDQEKNKLKEEMSEESRHILDLEEEPERSLHVLYGLHRLFLDEKLHPKSGWGNPVREIDIGVGDDVERLHRIYSTIESNIQNPVNVSIESYTRLLDIIIKTLKRMDHVAEFEKKLKKLDYNIILRQAKNAKNVFTLM